MKVKGLFYIWVFSLVLLLGMFKNGIAATASTSDIAEGDAAWYELTVETTGVVDVNAWTDGSTENDDISMSLYDPTGKQVASDNGYYNKASITYTATTTGTFKVKVYLSDAYNGGTRKITMSSPLQLSASSHYKETSIGIDEADAVWFELSVGSIGVVDVNAWTDGSTENDDISMSLYDPTGKQVASDNGYYNKASITYTTTTTGTFKVRVYLSDAYNSGTRKITVSSLFQLSASPHYKVISSDIVEGDAAWYELTVGSTGVVDINAWTDGSTENDDISMSLYDPTGKQVSSDNGYYNRASITYTTTTTGTFKVKVYLSDAYNGGTRKITIASNYSLSDFNPPSDTTPPTVSSTSPSNGATGVAIDTSITATFSEAMDSTTISISTFTISGGMTGTVSYDSTTKTATFTPSSKLSYATTYTATITTGVKDSAGNAMSSNYTWSFTTTSGPDTTAPTGSISINSGAAYTISTSVTLALSATDGVGVTGYYLSESSSKPTSSASGWTTVSSTTSYSGSISYTLSSGDGDKTVYVWYKDAAENVSASASDTITLDTTAPTVVGTIQVGIKPVGVDVNPNTNRVYVSFFYRAGA